MTAVTHGADLEALRLLAEEMLTHAEYSLGVGLRTHQQLTALRWHGTDAERARAHWESVELPRIRSTSRVVAEAAGDVLQHLQQQELASSTAAGGAAAPTTPRPGGPAAAPPSSATSSLAGRARALVDLLANGPELAQVAAVIAASGGRAASMTRAQHELVSGLVGAVRPGIGAAVRAAGHLGTAVNVYDAAVGVHTGDVTRATGGLGGLVTTAAGGPAVGAAWGAGYAIGTAVNDGIEGTTYGDHFRARNDAAFDTLGAGGLLIVPGNLAVAAWDTLTGKADDGD